MSKWPVSRSRLAVLASQFHTSFRLQTYSKEKADSPEERETALRCSSSSSVPSPYTISMDARNQSSGSKLVLYSYWQSSCSWRVRFALNLKGLAYEYRAVNLPKGEQFSAEFERLNPLHYVPALVDGDVVVSDSFAIILYLEERYPQRTLLPTDPQLQALNFQKELAGNVGQQECLSRARSVIGKGFQALEKLLNKYASKYATGEEIYMADVFLAPQIAVAVSRFHIDLGEFPSLSRVYESYQALPEFQASSPARQPDAVC